MSANTFGILFRLTTFGESHGKAVGGIIDGFPAGIEIDLPFIQKELNRRKPGNDTISSSRKEPDNIEVLSGIFEGKSTGTPIAFYVGNKDSKPGDYDHLRGLYRPSHADYSYQAKYGIRDHRGGGRASARETLCRVVGGAFAKIVLHKAGISFITYVKQIGHIKLIKDPDNASVETIDKSIVRCPDKAISKKMERLLSELRKSGDTTGGVVRCIVKGVPAGLGEPVFDKLHADLAKAMMSINAAKGFEYGEGFRAAEMHGSEHNDEFILKQASGNKKNTGYIGTKTNYSGGIQGGISNGEDIYFNVAFKPIPTLMREQNSVDEKGNKVKFTASGRHDVCAAPRAVPVVEGMAAMVILDHFLRNNAYKH